jgi:twitching motility protein PilT
MNEMHTLSQEMSWLFDQTIDNHASDLHVMAGASPCIRVDAQLRPLDVPPYTVEKAQELLAGFIGPQMEEKINTTRKELDFSFTYRDQRLRANIFYAKGVLNGSVRLLANQALDLVSLGASPVLSSMIDQKQGLIILAGPTGHGKSTTLAAMVSMIADRRRGHIITIEDPIEYIFEQRKSIISQREVGVDTPSFSSALRSALREDPDVVLVGEMRDLETVEAALQMAETGHLVLTSLHTNSASQTAERIIGMFPSERQNQVRQQLADMLVGIISQRLLPKVQGGRTLVSEVLVANPAVRSILREGKTHQLPNLIQTSAAEGMISMDKALAELVSKGEVSIDEALTWAVDPKNLKMMIY